MALERYSRKVGIMWNILENSESRTLHAKPEWSVAAARQRTPFRGSGMGIFPIGVPFHIPRLCRGRGGSDF